MHWADFKHYSDMITRAMASQITGFSLLCSNVCSGADQREHANSASLAYVKGNQRWPLDSLHKGPVTEKIFPFHEGIMEKRNTISCSPARAMGRLFKVIWWKLAILKMFNGRKSQTTVPWVTVCVYLSNSICSPGCLVLYSVATNSVFMLLQQNLEFKHFVCLK